MADFGGSDLDAFRTEAREWLEANFPKSLAADPDAAQTAMMGGVAPTGDALNSGAGVTAHEQRHPLSHPADSTHDAVLAEADRLRE